MIRISTDLPMKMVRDRCAPHTHQLKDIHSPRRHEVHEVHEVHEEKQKQNLRALRVFVVKCLNLIPMMVRDAHTTTIFMRLKTFLIRAYPSNPCHQCSIF